MSTTLVQGLQWGDEGKGKIIDYLSSKVDFVVRYHGGNNAGHTVINEYGKFPMHLVPSGIFHKKTKAIIANGVVLNLSVLVDEIEMLDKAGITLTNRLFISPRCHLIMPYHIIFDRLFEEAKGKGKTGTTGRGIGPVHADKVSYHGIRLFDLLDTKTFSEKLAIQLGIKNKILQAFGEKQLNQKDIEEEYLTLSAKIRPFIREPFPMLSGALRDKKRVLFEGAHGVFLDNDWGTYPFVSASTVLAGGIVAGSGMPIQSLKTVVGVAKAYATRVGEGPFPTELLDKTGDRLREKGGEFGTTTGRPRRCGWLDLELLKFACFINGTTDIALTKLDVLDDFSEIKLCIGYTHNGKKVSYADGDTKFLGEVKPVYKTMKGWQGSVKGMTRKNMLPKEAKEYIRTIEDFLGVRVSYISTDAKRQALIRT